MRLGALLLVLSAVLVAGYGSSAPTTPKNSARSDQLTKKALAVNWENDVSSKGRWFARFANATQIAFSCDVTDNEARRLDQKFNSSFSAALLTEFEAACERGSSDGGFYNPSRAG
jgi:hypothetical protein